MSEIKAEEIVKYLNDWMKSTGHNIRFISSKSVGVVIDITIIDDYVDSSIINLKAAFYKDLESVLKNKFNITDISYNNTRSCFWKHYGLRIV